ncbi:uncharacterized protein MELLADRAFT_65256 [Melampsora larici-populina 98AG31]|uniref:Uncharacterized protein n=1 Tax=Melampsora larici-populina (strain 98AG31 / pathotype 3-4-7) TaxID=747676 RepID=F4RUM8_MELLP|nr:uncharacterized protein MELLADRAFT_65256 [Melampsora larici-populina 98AG31]EGG03968.1 hypothetical protein MELLADRAFT_65256 [Melampsora larici-populina 98AG31]
MACYKPGAAAAAALKAANQARAEAEKAAKESAAGAKSSSSLLHPPSPSGSRTLRPRSPQATQTAPGFVAQPRDSRLAVPSPLRQSPIKILHDDPTSDKAEISSDKESSSAESTVSRSGGKQKKKKGKVSKNKKGKARAKSQKKRSKVPKALAKMVDNDSDIEMVPNPKNNQPGKAEQTEEPDKLFDYYDDPKFDPAHPPTIVLNNGDDVVEDGDEDLEEPPSKDNPDPCVGDSESDVNDNDLADKIEATEIVSAHNFV